MGRPEDFRHVSQNGFGHTLRIFGNLSIPEANDSPAQPFEKCRALSVVRRIDMLAPVELDGQFRRSAGQLENVVSDDQLPGKARTAAGNQVPDCALSVRCAIA